MWSVDYTDQMVPGPRRVMMEDNNQQSIEIGFREENFYHLSARAVPGSVSYIQV